MVPLLKMCVLVDRRDDDCTRQTQSAKIELNYKEMTLVLTIILIIIKNNIKNI